MVSPSPRTTRLAVVVTAVIAVVVLALVVLTEPVGRDRRRAQDGSTTTAAQPGDTVVTSDGSPIPDGLVPDDAPYPHRLVAAGDRLHLFHVWRTGPGAEGNTALSYVVSDDAGRRWSTLDGDELSTPIGPEEGTIVQKASEDLVLVNSGGAVVDRTGTPHALVRVRGGIDGGLWLAHPEGNEWRFDRLPGTLDAAGRGVLVVHDRGMLAL